ncbi:translation initiation factor IF-2, partial [Helicobacter pylori]|nr:translation initiation factor IF-2 [Helicobacter pylori]
MSGMVDLKEFLAELGKTQKELKNVIEQAKDIGLELKTNSKMTPEQAGKLYKYIVDGIKEQIQANQPTKNPEQDNKDDLNTAVASKPLNKKVSKTPKKEEKSQPKPKKTKEKKKEAPTPIIKKKEIEIVNTFENQTPPIENTPKVVSHSQIEKAKQKLQEIQKSREALNKLTQSNANNANSTNNANNAKKEISEVKKQEQEIKRHENIKRRTGFRVIKRNDETENESENSVTESKKPTQSAAAIFEDIKKEWQEKDKQE